VDLDPDGPAPVVEVYRRIHYPVILTSTQTGQGLDELRRVLADRISVVAGQSGVGKSSLLNALQPGLELATAPVSQANEKGRHTTTLARLHTLDFGGFVVDTPGVRSYELAEIPPEHLEEHFVEMAPLVADCKFSDCTHTHEEGCAIKAAVEAETIDLGRYESYLHMFSQD
jgi:ribosome biogenesis GTPase